MRRLRSVRVAATRAMRASTAIAIVGTSVFLASCTVKTAPLAGNDPTDATSPVAKVGYRSTLAGYQSQRPVQPSSWIEQNQRVAPPPQGSK